MSASDSTVANRCIGAKPRCRSDCRVSAYVSKGRAVLRTSLSRGIAVWTISLAWTVVAARADVLYDAVMNSTPDDQGWAYLTNPLFDAAASQEVVDGILSLNTHPNIGEQAGYFSKIPALSFSHPNHPIIDLAASPFSIEFTMRQVFGIDVPDTDPLAAGERNRGGFAVIAISEALTGVELQFQTDHIVALDDVNTAFPIGDIQAFDTTDALHDYELILATDGYQLFADESLVLQGPLRNYSDVAPSAPISFPYTTPSFLFFGDDTGRGSALTELTQFKASALVPNPICGDFDSDGDVDSADRTIQTQNWTGAGQPEEFNKMFSDGDADGDFDVDTADVTCLIQNWTGAQLLTPDDVSAAKNDIRSTTLARENMDMVVLSSTIRAVPELVSADSMASDVPEPSGFALAMLGVFESAVRRRRKQACWKR